MKVKAVLKFYYSADRLDRALDNLVLANAFSQRCAEVCAERIIDIIETKKSLASFWAYLNGVIERFSDGEKKVLMYYSSLHGGIRKLNGEVLKEIKRVTVKFSRRARFLRNYKSQIDVINEYYCLL